MGNTKAIHLNLKQLIGLVALLRPRQWIKNGFVLAPLLFSGQFLSVDSINRALLASLLFCLASSAAYIVNDIHDVEDDRRHLKKSRTRPLAAGIVSLPSALVVLVLLYGTVFSCWFVVPEVIVVIGAYLALNIAYTLILKHQPVVDIFTIAINFVLRVYAGAQALMVPLSDWMFVTTLCLALYLGALKRRQELDQYGLEGRKVLKDYSIALVDRYAKMSAIGTLVFYGMFVMSAKPQLVMTIPLVLFGLFRYWYVVERQNGGESPADVLLADWQLLLTVLLWVGACALALWPGLNLPLA